GLQPPALTRAQCHREQNVDVGRRFICVQQIRRYEDVAHRYILCFGGCIEGACRRLNDLPPLRHDLQGQSLGETRRVGENALEQGLHFFQLGRAHRSSSPHSAASASSRLSAPSRSVYSDRTELPGASLTTFSAASACCPRYISSSASAAACPTTWLNSASSCATGIPLTSLRPCWPRAVATKPLNKSGWLESTTACAAAAEPPATEDAGAGEGGTSEEGAGAAPGTGAATTG